MKVVFVLMCLMGWQLALIDAMGQDANKQRISVIQLPKVSEFEIGLKAEDARDVGSWMTDLEVAFSVNDYDVWVHGEYGRTYTMRDGAGSTVLNALSFRIARDVSNEKRRIISSEQSLLDNPAIDFGNGTAIDRARGFDLLFDDSEDTVFLRRAGARNTISGKSREVVEMIPRQVVFHPFRASVTGVDQILNGGGGKISGHSVSRSTAKRIAKRGPLTFVWLEVGGSQASVNQIVAFDKGCPVQVDQWFAIDKITDRIIPYETVRTEWKEVEEQSLPIRVYGVRSHKVRPAEFYFEYEWQWKVGVPAELFTVESLGGTSVVPL